ncbi:MAG: hypothetical protein ABJN42_26535, partial [Roseibium sp.]|uniref:hypothetical protein n=1 Tax=Roseibium sp. TaxID=1936156 RepID=UPI0032996449
HARTGGRAGAFTLIDVFPDRLEISTSTAGTGRETPVTMVRRDAVPEARLDAVLSDAWARGAETIVYVFSNQLLNVLLRAGTEETRNAVFINVPVALMQIGTDGRLDWSAGFRRLMHVQPTYPQFRSSLARLLGAGSAPAGSTASAGHEASASGAVSRGRGLLDRLATGLEIAAVIVLCGVSGLIVWWTERRF